MDMFIGKSLFVKEEINMKFKKLATAILLGAAGLSGTAQAAIESPALAGFDNLGGSELVFTVFDTATGDSYSRDLGVGFNDINAASSYSFGADANLLGLLGSGSLVWNVLGGDNNTAGSTADPANHGRRLLATSNSGSPVIDNITDSADLTQLRDANQKVDSLVQGLNVIAPHDDGVVANNGSSVVNGGSASWGSVVAPNGGIGGTNNVSGAVGDTLAFFLFGETGPMSSNPFTGANSMTAETLTTALLGAWTFDSAGTLTFNGSSAVPVPAAVWLFGSALLGLVGVSRRKQALA